MSEQNEVNLARAGQLIACMRTELARVMIGQTDVVEHVLYALFAGGHVLLEGVPGLGKTLLLKALAKCIDGSFARIQFTPDLMPSDVTGHAMFDRQKEQFYIRRGPVFTHFLLADEINRAPAKTQAALLEVMQEQQVTIEGESFVLDLPFMVMATQNPIELEGTYPLPEAELDRFLLKVNIDYPAVDEEERMVAQVTRQKSAQGIDVTEVQACLTIADVLAIQNLVAQIAVDEQIVHYAVAIVRQTRAWTGIRRGAGPRGSISLVRAARVRALLAGRDYVLPEDIKAIAAPVLRHRIVLAAELEIEGYHPDRVLQDVLQNVPVPRQ